MMEMIKNECKDLLADIDVVLAFQTIDAAYY
jgi:hypothetical protein